MNRAFKGIWIPKEIWVNKELKVMEKIFLVEIDSLDNDDGCFASNAYFADFFEISKGRCSQIIKSLEEKKMIEIRYEMEGKEIKKRVIKVVNKLNRGSKENKQGYLENDEDSNTVFNNTKDIVEKTHDTNSLEIKKIVEYLNKKADKNFKPSSSATKKHINARLNEGFTFDDFVVVIDSKVAEWKDDKTMMKYIRPETLFGGKFDGYLNENTKKRKEQKESNSKGFNLDSFHDDV